MIYLRVRLKVLSLPFRKLAAGLWKDDSDQMDKFNSLLEKHMTNDTAGLDNDRNRRIPRYV